jgi:hypothetical protein
MLRTIALTGFAVAVAIAPLAALAQTGYSSSYGAYPGQGMPTQSLTPFDRSWNQFNQSKREARAGARFMRRHYFVHPRY